MGLDNGIVLHSREPIIIPLEVRATLEVYPLDRYFNYNYDLCYWRKCWNIRRAVAQVLEAGAEYVGKCFLTISEVKGIWWALNELDDEKTWEASPHGSIWTYDEIKDNLQNSMLSLEWLIFFMRNTDERLYMVEFYDSY